MEQIHTNKFNFVLEFIAYTLYSTNNKCWENSMYSLSLALKTLNKSLAL